MPLMLSRTGQCIFLATALYIIDVVTYRSVYFPSGGFCSPDPYLEIPLEVNLNFQVRLTIILANGIFPGRIYLEVRC